LLEQASRLVSKGLAQVEAQLQQVADQAPSPLSELVRGSLFPPGKRVRPVLVLLSAKATGELDERAVRVAAAVELVHTASLIHDDIVDASPLRRGRPTAHKQHGAKVAVLGGDYLIAQALMIAGSLRDLAMIDQVSELMVQMTEAEVAQFAEHHQVDVAEQDYLDVIRGKTAALLSASCALGALAGQASVEQVNALKDYGYHVGMAFQITDDTLDFTSDPTRLGKPVGEDISEGKLTLPVLLALRNRDKTKTRQLKALLASQVADTLTLERILALVKELGGAEAARQVASEHCARAQEAISALPRTKARAALFEVAGWVVERDH
jgi:geranylgeranyl pyrophosphate synthase